MHIPLLSTYNDLTNFPTTEIEGGGWYILHFNGPNKLNAIGVVIKFLNTNRLNYRLWVPSKKIFVYKGSNLILMNDPIYLDYVFINIKYDLNVYEQLKKEMKNVKLLAPADIPYKLSVKEVDQIKAIHSELNTSAVSETSVKNFKYKVGESVRISYGPFSDMVGKIDDITGTQIVLLISCFGKEIKFFVPLDKSHFMIKSV